MVKSNAIITEMNFHEDKENIDSNKAPKVSKISK